MTARRAVESYRSGRAAWRAGAAVVAWMALGAEASAAALPEIRREVDPREPKNAAAGFYALLYDRLTLTLGGLQAGDRLNFEVDMLARYVQRLAEAAGTKG